MYLAMYLYMYYVLSYEIGTISECYDVYVIYDLYVVEVHV